MNAAFRIALAYARSSQVYNMHTIVDRPTVAVAFPVSRTERTADRASIAKRSRSKEASGKETVAPTP